MAGTPVPCQAIGSTGALPLPLESVWSRHEDHLPARRTGRIVRAGRDCPRPAVVHACPAGHPVSGHAARGGGRHRPESPHLQGAPDPAGQAWRADPVVPTVDSRQSQPERPDQQGRRPDLHRQWQQAGVEARSVRCVRVQGAGAGRCERAAGRVRIPLAAGAGPGPGGDDAQHAQPAVEPDHAVSGRLLRASDPGPGQRQVAGRLVVRHCRRDRLQGRRYSAVQDPGLGHAAGFAAVRRPSST